MIVWRKVAVRHGSWPIVGYVGSVEVFRIINSALTPYKAKPYWLFNLLPGAMKNDDDRAYGDNPESLKVVAEKILEDWLDRTGLMVK
jgi:hypothetical protein